MRKPTAITAMILAVPLLAAAGLAKKESRESRATFTSRRPAEDLIACLVPATGWTGNPTVSPAGQNRTRIVSDTSGIITMHLMVVGGAPSLVEVRTKLPKRLKKSIEECL